MDRSQYAELFLAESREHLSTINQLLLEWERDPSAVEPVAGLFRSVHTIKGMAGTMGYGAVADLAHRAENLLDLVRHRDEPAGDEIMELLFRCADVLEQSIESAVAGRDAGGEIPELVRELDRVAGSLEGEVQRPRGAHPSEPMVVAPAPPTGGGRTIRIAIQASAALKGARAAIILARLAQLGRVHGTEPSTAAMEDESFNGEFSCRLDSQASADEIATAVRASGDVAEVQVGEVGVGAETARADAARTRHIRVDLSRLDALMNEIGELVAARGQLTALASRRADPELEEVSDRVTRLSEDLQREIVQARMTPVWQVFDRFPRLVRDLARQLGKQVAFRIEGKEIELDRAILDEIGDPLVHLLRNALDHGIELPEGRVAAGKPAEATVALSATRERATVAIEVRDDGRGIDRAKVLAQAKSRGVVDQDVERLTDELLLKVLARSGFSTAAEVSGVSGRGVGVDAVVTRVRALGGTLEVRSEQGVGTTFTLRLPTTLAIVRALVTQVGEEQYALPLTYVAETVVYDEQTVTRLADRDGMTLRDGVLPLVHLRELLQANGDRPKGAPVIVLQVGQRRSGLVVDRLLGQQEIVVKSFPALRGMLPVFSGATVLSGGRPALILDAGGFV
jgi:two-component system chemotaxis sensor kinase CheA